MKYTIIADSACDLKDNDIKSTKTTFATVPLIVSINEKDYVDNEYLDTKELVAAMRTNKSAPKTACPSPEAFAEKMRSGNDYVFCITITSKLSGTYNSACLAAEMVRTENPKKKIFVIDSLGASASIIIIINRLVELIESEKYGFEEIIEKISKIRSNTRLRFLLHDLGNLVKTGRMSRVKGIIASALNIKLVLGENGEGEIKEFGKTMGTKKAIQILSCFPEEKIKTDGNEIPVVITHCHNEEDAGLLKQLLESKFGLKNIKIYLMRGLASFYANDKGMLLGY